MRKVWFLAAALAAAPAAIAQQGAAAQPPARYAADLRPTEGWTAAGHVEIFERGGRVVLRGYIAGLAPGSTHGLHVHEAGDCSDNAEAAGGHFNPLGLSHGAPDAAQRHVGDLGNVMADEKGQASFEIHDSVVKLSGPNSIVGRALVLHSRADDMRSQPAGNSGERIACGVIVPE